MFANVQQFLCNLVNNLQSCKAIILSEILIGVFLEVLCIMEFYFNREFTFCLSVEKCL